jgi:methyl-accepting chemotaxis protein
MAAAGGAQETSGKMAHVASAASQLRNEAGAVDDKTRECVTLAAGASKQAVGAGPVVQNLGVVSSRIQGVVTLVSQIARQTNLLALNATIEAARAGDSGRGFAVVASEVKELARKTASATSEIGDEIQQVETAARQVSSALHRICEDIQGVDRITSVIAESVQRQRESADAIAGNVQKAALATDEVSQGIQLVTEAALQTGECATRLLDAADELSRQSEQLRNYSKRYVESTARKAKPG